MKKYFLIFSKQLFENPKILLHRLSSLFQVTCVFLAVYMTVKLSVQYGKNKDATSILYKHYNKGHEDKYPTFSICFQGTRFVWYHDVEIFRAFGLPGSEYQRMLSGKAAIKYEYNLTSRLYKKTQAFMDPSLNAKFQNFHIQLSDFVLKSEFATEQIKQIVHYENNIIHPRMQPTFYIGYQTPNMICFTRKSVDRIGDVRLYDYLSLNRSILNTVIFKDINIQFFVHHPDHLMRSINNPFLVTSFSKYQTNKLLEIVISQGTVLRKRADSNDACSKAANKHDTHLRKQISRKFKCVPPYWSRRLKDMLGLQECESPESLKNVDIYLKTYENFLNLHDQPCMEMFNSVFYNWKLRNDDDTGLVKLSDPSPDKIYRFHFLHSYNDSLIKFIYRDRQYEEIQFQRLWVGKLLVWDRRFCRNIHWTLIDAISGTSW